ncbi:MAG: extracellular solute-binding protein, partial [Synergistaceae bacterium]|nr:extracellular solute-binding protein [Synergistaceae bacterium]
MPGVLKKIFSVSVLLMLALIASAACAKTESGELHVGEATDTQNANENGGNEEAGDGGEVDIMTLVAKADLGGFEMRFLTDIIWDWDFGPMHMECVEEQNGEPVNDAFYIRNTILEDRLNIKISEKVCMGNDAPAQMKKMIGSGDSQYDVLIGWSVGVGPLVTEGMFVNLNEVPGLRIDEPWWDQHSIRDYSIKNHLYFMTGDYNLLNNDATWMLYFNKAMTQELGLDMPYSLVREGKWTFDKMMEYQKAAALDLDGDGQWTAADRWGQVTHTQHYTGILIAGGENLVTRDANGLPVYGQTTERFHDVY